MNSNMPHVHRDCPITYYATIVLGNQAETM